MATIILVVLLIFTVHKLDRCSALMQGSELKGVLAKLAELHDAEWCKAHSLHND